MKREQMALLPLVKEYIVKSCNTSLSVIDKLDLQQYNGVEKANMWLID